MRVYTRVVRVETGEHPLRDGTPVSNTSEKDRRYGRRVNRPKPRPGSPVKRIDFPTTEFQSARKTRRLFDRIFKTKFEFIDTRLKYPLLLEFPKRTWRRRRLRRRCEITATTTIKTTKTRSRAKPRKTRWRKTLAR